MPEVVLPFTAGELTEFINTGDKKYGKFSDAGIFGTPKPLAGRIAYIDIANRTLRAAGSHPLGAPGSDVSRDTASTRVVEVPHFPARDAIAPVDVAGQRLVGTQERMALAPHIADVLGSHRDRFEMTREYLFAGALRGIVRDGFGNTLFNVFTEFGVAQVTKSISSTVNLQLWCMELSRAIEDGMHADTMNGVDVYCSRTYFDNLLTIPSFREVFLNTEQAMARLGSDVRNTGIQFAGVNFIEYSGQIRNEAGVMEKLVPEGEAIPVPRGTRNTFKQWVAPPDFNETINRAQTTEFWAKMEAQEFGRGYKLHSQFNILPAALNPNVLLRLTIAP